MNSEGGLIIWGSPIGEYSDGSKEKVFEGALSPLDISLTKDSFINKVTDQITPSPRGIKFYKYSNNGKHVYLIEVEKSNFSPHQFEHNYFMRIDGQTKIAPHHYVEALFFRAGFRF